jgi:hypothetical protein
MRWVSRSHEESWEQIQALTAPTCYVRRSVSEADSHLTYTTPIALTSEFMLSAGDDR